VSTAPAPQALAAAELPLRPATAFPAPFAAGAAGRERRPLAAAFGLENFSVMLTRLTPGARQALRHAHSRQEEFVYVLEGTATLHTAEGRTELEAGMCAGFRPGTAHDVTNETDADVLMLEIGDRSPGDAVTYPDADLLAVPQEGRYAFLHKDGTPY
jgi:uncharacterized cupin superfamily protein